MTRPLNEAGEYLIKSFESSDPYNPPLDPYKDGGGVPTIGWGHTRGVTMGMDTITLADAQRFFLQDIKTAQDAVEHYITVDLNDNQYAALVSLTFNAGTAPLKMTLGAKLNNGDYNGAAEQFMRWVHDHGVVVKGLVRRRSAERALFLS